jgi:hypothetical protein
VVGRFGREQHDVAGCERDLFGTRNRGHGQRDAFVRALERQLAFDEGPMGA